MKIDAVVEGIGMYFLNVTYESAEGVILTFEVEVNEVTKNWKVGDLVSATLKVVG